jgi:hypothetical protein
MSSAVITKTDAAVEERRCAFFDTEVTSMFINSSRLRSASVPVEGLCCGAAKQGRELRSRKNAQISRNAICERYRTEGRK